MAVVQSFWSIAAAWVEAFGTIGAVVGAAWIAAGESRSTRRRELGLRAEAQQKELKVERATKTAALNMAIMASTQIHDLHVLLLDENWRGRVTRVSPSRTLLGMQNMLIAFPIQSLADAPAMVEFCRFPAALATAAEVYANLEAAVRAAAEPDRSAIFDAYRKMMERIDTSAKRSLAALKSALQLDDVEGERQGEEAARRLAAATRTSNLDRGREVQVAGVEPDGLASRS